MKLISVRSYENYSEKIVTLCTIILTSNYNLIHGKRRFQMSTQTNISPEFGKDSGPGDSLERNFLKACRKSLWSPPFPPRWHDDMNRVTMCVKLLNVDVNCQVEGNSSYLFSDERDPNIVCTRYLGFTALHLAFDNFTPNCSRLQRFLLSLPNIDVNIKDADGQTPVMMVISKSIRNTWSSRQSCDKSFSVSSLQRLLSVDNLELDTEDHHNSFAHTVVNNWLALEFIEMLKDDPRMNWNVKNKDGKTPIQVAVDMEFDDVVRALVMIEAVDKSMIPPVFLRSVEEVENLKKRKREGLPECPVCTNNYKKDQQIFHCAKGHLVCGDCRPRLEHCAECRGTIIGRAHGFEKYLSTIAC